jgi:hypothetical protein
MRAPISDRLSTLRAFREDDRGMSQTLALGALLGSALILAVSLGVFMLAGG